jgi:hypothetical protein
MPYALVGRNNPAGIHLRGNSHHAVTPASHQAWSHPSGKPPRPPAPQKFAGITFLAVRLLVASIQHHIGPFQYVTMGGRHIHHLVWGILILLGVGYGYINEVGSGSTPASIFAGRLMSILYGVGAALTLDEFALWLNLAPVYWSREGRESIDAVVLFGALLAMGTWGAPLYSAMLRKK